MSGPFDGDACGPGCGFCGRCSGGPRANATCSACREDFYKGRFDIGSLCDDCCAARDAHAEALRTADATPITPITPLVPERMAS